MIEFAVGTSLGILLAFIVGRLRGRGSEVITALFGIPVFTYAFSVPFRESWPDNTYICAGTCLSLLQWAGMEVFLSSLVAVAYSYLKARKSLSIDEYIKVSYLALGIFAGAVTLSSTLLPALIVPGILAYTLFTWPRKGSSIKFLKVERAGFLEGVEVYTDEKSIMAFKDGRMLFIGGAVLKEFPRSREFAECILKAPNPSSAMKLAILIVGFLPATLLFIVPRGVLAIAVYGIVILMTTMLLGKVAVSGANKRLPEECREVLKEYSDFIREKKGKLDIVID
ncbi:hypothetical protein [Thermococcus peptonophilus]|uniref:Uncharacterized protein n=1 Tax=Thermococcus peptonophilus TaxID=53952 RepID=A0A142CWN1_9EURY|nr:hypothetical protein [Thermococcus peptonophilus]AMQ19183.1 hypothetical protein A0127_08410 [Thermococcus peptonophilus]